MDVEGDIKEERTKSLEKGEGLELTSFAQEIGLNDMKVVHDVRSGFLNLEVRDGDSYFYIFNVPNSFSLRPQKRGSGFLINNCFVDPGVQDVEFSQLKQRSGVSTNGKLGFHDRGRKYGSSQ